MSSGTLETIQHRSMDVHTTIIVALYISFNVESKETQKPTVKRCHKSGNKEDTSFLFNRSNGETACAISKSESAKATDNPSIVDAANRLARKEYTEYSTNIRHSLRFIVLTFISSE